MNIRPCDCVIGRTYLLNTEKGWEEAIALGLVNDRNAEFLLRRRGLFGTRLFAPRRTVSVFSDSLRISEPPAQKLVQ